MVSNLSDEQKVPGTWTVHMLVRRWRWVPLVHRMVTVRAEHVTWEEVYDLLFALEQSHVSYVAHPGECQQEPPNDPATEGTLSP